MHEPIIDKITFYKAQEILNPKGKNTYNIQYKDLFPLTKFLKCPNCNRNLAASYSKGRHKKYPYYHCITKGCTKETYLKKSNEFDSEIISRKIQLNDYENQIINVDQLIEFGKEFFLNLSKFWIILDTPRKRCLQEMLFPEGIYIENNEFRTPAIRPYKCRCVKFGLSIVVRI